MFEIYDFEKSHIEKAQKIALMNYNEERSAVAELPDIISLPDLSHFADNGLGVVLCDGSDVLGFLCCYEPWDNAFNSTAKGAFSPTHAHGAAVKNREVIYKRLYQAAAEKWVKNKITYHAIALYSHDTQAINTFFQYGFGLRCIEAVRPLTNIECIPCDGIVFKEITKAEVIKVREMEKMRISHYAHYAESPCFMFKPLEVEVRDSRWFIAIDAETPIAYIEVTENGENFATEVSSMKNICGAFCEPEYRGKGIIQGLLNFVISKVKAQGVYSLGVEFEGFNPTGNGFWLKHFTAYTNSVTRRIDDWVLQD